MAKLAYSPVEDKGPYVTGAGNGSTATAASGGKGANPEVLHIIPRPPEVLYGEDMLGNPQILPPAPDSNAGKGCQFSGGCQTFRPSVPGTNPGGDTVIPVVQGQNPVLKPAIDTGAGGLPSWLHEKYLGVELWLWLLLILFALVVLK